MQLTEASCPLCKHPIIGGSGNSDPTRLCEDCRRMVQRIRSTSSIGVAVMDPPQALSMRHPQAVIPVQTEMEITNTVIARETSSFRESATQCAESDPFVFDSPVCLDRDPFDLDEMFEDVSLVTFHVPELPRHSTESSCDRGELPVSPAIAEPMCKATPQPQDPGSLPAELAEGLSVTTGVIAAVTTFPAELTEGDLASDCRIDATTDGPTVRTFFQHEVVTDPLEDPVQTRIYSSQDQAFLIPEAQPSKVARLKLSVAAALVLCCGIAAYFLMYQPLIQASQTELASTPVGQAASQSLRSVSGPASEAKEIQRLQSEKEKSDARYALQAGAFPNEAGANEFCERLKRAGVPAYIVSADIAGRGRWFRIRVGRFESTQDADRFASESRRRARAAGLSLQLIVSSYDKP